MENPELDTLKTMREVISDDAYAMTFQTMAQYRQALIHSISALIVLTCLDKAIEQSYES